MESYKEVQTRGYTDRSVGGTWTPYDSEQTTATGILGELSRTIELHGVVTKHIRFLYKNGDVIGERYNGLTGEIIPREKTGDYSVRREGKIETDPETNKLVLNFKEYFEPKYFEGKEFSHPKSVAVNSPLQE